jgi:transcriptional regulator with XRE-family HTH domain
MNEAVREQGSVGRWLKDRCQKERLSLRKAGARTGLSHAAIRDIMKGTRPLPETILKLATGFGGNGTNQRIALEDHLLLLAGYRHKRPRKAELTESAARLMDKVKGLTEPQIKAMTRFADFLAEIEKGEKTQKVVRLSHRVCCGGSTGG